MEVVQVLLEQHREREIRNQIAWLPVDARIKKESKLTLKDDPDSWVWEIAKVYSTKQQSEEVEHRKWGLDLPKNQRTEY